MSEWLQIILDTPLIDSFTYKNNPLSPTKTGMRVEINFHNRKTKGFVISESDTFPTNTGLTEKDIPKIKTIIKTIDKQVIFGKNEIELAKWISNYYLCSHGEALSAMIPSGKKDSGLAFLANEESFNPDVKVLSEEQINALDGICSGKNKINYLFGSTGSGKTEVFLQAAEKIIKNGKSVIYLVPEISLTHQVINDVKSRFGDEVAVLHSGLTGSQRLSEWMRIKRNEAKIVIGARSAIFAPTVSLGLIIIDEEHDGSYKSGNTPRYHARQVAMKRAIEENAILVMGSATPSMEAWLSIKNKEMTCYKLTKRLAGGATPSIETIPLYDSKVYSKVVGGCLSEELINEIKEAKKEGRQSILFLNRRGFTHFFKCRTCGATIKCKNCSVALTYHKSKGKMICHYCGWQTDVPKSCPECGSLDAGFSGFGTEYIEDEIKKVFPNFTYCRVDTDSISSKEDTKKIFEDFRKGKIDILLGTQMVAKGLNFPGLKVVGVVLADTGLNLPDFRSAERTFSLLVQVAGRAGRFFPDGKVLIQTFSPNTPAIQLAAKLNIEEFYTQELQQRKILEFPPYFRLIRLVFRSKNSLVAQRAAEDSFKIFSDLLNKAENTDILGPSECPLALISGNSRWQIILRSKKISFIHNACRIFTREYKYSTNVYIEIDVDPVSLL